MTRRGALLSAGAAGLAGCTSWPELKNIPRDAKYDVVDAHTHLFSASDLPVMNFFRYVIGPKFGLPTKASLALSYLCEALKTLSPTATEELAKEPDLAFNAIDLSKAEFASNAADASVERQGGSLSENAWRTPDPTDKAGGTAEDQGLFYFLLAYSNGGKRSEQQLRDIAVNAGLRSFDSASATPPRKAAEARKQLILDVLKQAEADRKTIKRTPAAAPTFRTASDFGTLSILKDFSLESHEIILLDITPEKVVSAFVWAFNLLKPRTRHILNYLETYATGMKKEPPRTVMNFLVDYDKWLNDHPSPGSGMVEQIDLWHRARAHYKDDVDIHTFAGYCPLKHAIEKRLKVSPSAFNQLQQLIPAKAVGIKLYPPMGFQPIGNEALKDKDFIGAGGIGEVALDAWKETKPNPGELGRALDDALGETYLWCRDNDIPIVAHAGPGMKAGAAFGDRTDTKFWHDVARAYQGKIRMSLGHLIHDAGKFTNYVFPPKPGMLLDKGDNVQADGGWAAISTKEFLEEVARKGWPVYFDVGYTEEIFKPDVIDGDDQDPEYLPIKFFRALREWSKNIDPNCEHLVYGTDWIMLAQEPKHRFYLDKMQEWTERAGWLEEHRRNFFRENALRFLTPRKP